MKVMCKQVGGPEACTYEAEASDVSELAQKLKSHIEELATDADDIEHQATLDAMSEMKDDDSNNWLETVRMEALDAEDCECDCEECVQGDHSHHEISNKENIGNILVDLGDDDDDAASHDHDLDPEL